MFSVRRRSRVRLLTTSVAITVAMSILAATPALGYVGFKLQRYYPVSAEVDGAEPGNGMSVDFGIGQTFGVEFSVGWFTTDIPAQTVGTPLSVGLLVMPVTLSGFVQGRLGIGGVYALGGTGLYITDSFHGFDVEEKVSPGFQVGAGFWVWMFAIEARYIFVSPEIAGEQRSIDGWVVGLFGGVH